MKYETLMLQSLFAVCLLICLGTLGSMLIVQPATSKVAATHVVVAVEASSAS